MGYRKIWFAKGRERTAGLIVNDIWIEEHKRNLISDASRLFPRFEIPKMEKFFISPEFRTWEEAFTFDPGKSSRRRDPAKRYPPYPRGHAKVRKVLEEFQAGKLRSSSGQKVRSRKQAVAIALSEQRRAERKRDCSCTMKHSPSKRDLSPTRKPVPNEGYAIGTRHGYHGYYSTKASAVRAARQLARSHQIAVDVVRIQGLGNDRFIIGVVTP